MKKQSRTVIHRGQSDSQPQRHLPLVDILVNTQTELQALVVASGLKVLDAMLEEDRVAVCGPRYAHQPERRAYRARHATQRRRAQGRGAPAACPGATRSVAAHGPGLYEHRPAHRRVVEQLLVGVATRQYSGTAGRGRPHAGDEQECGTDPGDNWTLPRSTPLWWRSETQVGGHCVVGIEKTGHLGLREPGPCVRGFWRRGLRTDRSLLVILDRVTQTFGRAALVQRCRFRTCSSSAQVHAILTRLYEPRRQGCRRSVARDYPSATERGTGSR